MAQPADLALVTNADAFVARVQRFTREEQQQMGDFFRLLCLKLFRAIILRTPVDTGRARGNWQIGVNRIPVGEINIGVRKAKTKKGTKRDRRTKLPGMTATGARAMKAGNKQIQRADYWDILYIGNNVLYIRFLEGADGDPPSSIQAPEGITKPAIAQISSSFKR